MGVEGNVALVRRYCSYMAILDHKNAGALLADNFVQFVPAANPKLAQRRSKAEILDIMAGMTETCESSDMIVKGITAQDDRVAVEAESIVVFKDGKVYNNRYHLFFQIENDRIVTLKEYCDTAYALEAFGQ